MKMDGDKGVEVDEPPKRSAQERVFATADASSSSPLERRSGRRRGAGGGRAVSEAAAAPRLAA